MLDIEGWLFQNFDPKPYGNPQTDWRVDCPFCRQRVGDDDFKAHLHVAIDKQVCHCFRCDYGASWVGLVMDYAGLSYSRALGEIYQVPNPKDISDVGEMLADKPAERQNQPSKRVAMLPEGYIPLASAATSPALSRIRSYLQKRGFGRDVWGRYGLGYVPDVGLRVFIPIEGEYWQARAIFPFQEPKYLGPKIPSEDVLSHSVSLQIYDEVVVTEGVFSGISIGDNHVSLVGKNPTVGKVSRLVNSDVRHFIVTIEPDAVEPMLQLSGQLSAAGKRVTVWKYDEGDPADSSPTYIGRHSFDTRVRLLLSAYDS